VTTAEVVSLTLHISGTDISNLKSSVGIVLNENIITSQSCRPIVILPLTLNLLAPTTVGARINP